MSNLEAALQSLHEQTSCAIIYVAGSLIMPAVIDDGDDRKHRFTLLRDVELSYGEGLPHRSIPQGTTMIGYYQLDSAGNVCLSTDKHGDLTIPVEWIRIEALA